MTSRIPIGNYETSNDPATAFSPLHYSLNKEINGDLRVSSNLQI